VTVKELIALLSAEVASDSDVADYRIVLARDAEENAHSFMYPQVRLDRVNEDGELVYLDEDDELGFNAIVLSPE
jgi:hypothetical protein